MIRSAAVAALAATFLLTPTASAVFRTEHFAPLREELESRRDNDFPGTLDKTARKQQKSVLKALKLLDKNSVSATTDTKTLAKVAKGLSKAYPSEFASGSPDQTLNNLSWGVAQAFRDEDSSRVLELQYTAARMGSDSIGRKITSLLTKATAELSEFINAANVFEAAAIVGKATRYLDAAEKSAAKDKGGGNYLVYGNGGTPLVAVDPFAEFKAANGELQIYGQYTIQKSGAIVTVAVVVPSVDGTGTYTSGITGYYEVAIGLNGTRYDIVDGTASLTLDTFDLAGGVIAGTFSFQAYNDGNKVTTVFDRGEFRLTTIYEQ